MVPAVIYGAKEAPTLVQLEPKIVLREMVRGGWRSRLFDVKVGTTSSRALIREIQFHPVTDVPLHVDFQRLAPGQQIRVSVAVHYTNEITSPGLKKGGVLNIVRHTVEVMADPESVPEFFTADLAAIDIAENIRWSDLLGTENVAPVIAGRDFVIATLAPPTKAAEVVADPNAPAAAAPAGKAPAKAAAKPAAKK